MKIALFSHESIYKLVRESYFEFYKMEENYLDKYGFSEEDWQTCLRTLAVLKDNPLQNPDNQQFASLVTKIYKNAKKQLNGQGNQIRKQADINLTKQSEVAKNALEKQTLYQSESYQKQSYSKLFRTKKCGSIVNLVKRYNKTKI
ncbi:MAG: hypothetical protein ACI85I_001477 [Arenicella sp.]